MTQGTAFSTRPLFTRPRHPVDAQSGTPAFGAHPQHARAAGAPHRRVRLRTCSGGRDPRRQDALPRPFAACAPELARAILPLILSPAPPTTRRTAMINPSLFLRRAIQADAIFSGVSAVLLTFGTGELAPLSNLPAALLRAA